MKLGELFNPYIFWSKGLLQMRDALILDLGVLPTTVLTTLLDWQILLTLKGKIKDGESFHMTREHIESKTGISEQQQRTILRQLVERRLIVYHKQGLPPTNFYFINFDELSKIVSAKKEFVDDDLLADAYGTQPFLYEEQSRLSKEYILRLKAGVEYFKGFRERKEKK